MNQDQITSDRVTLDQTKKPLVIFQAEYICKNGNTFHLITLIQNHFEIAPK